jgi:cytochrome b pre-mRNA-processing protein 3
MRATWQAMSLIDRLLRAKPDPKRDLRPLWDAVVEQARVPAYYATCGVADTVAGRFDMVCAVLAAVLLRMERSPALTEASVHLTELFVDDMDGQLRELGIGDVVVGKHMGKLMSAMGGRLGAYRDGFAGDDAALAEAVERNVTLGKQGSAACVAGRLRALAARLEATADEALLAGAIA